MGVTQPRRVCSLTPRAYYARFKTCKALFDVGRKGVSSGGGTYRVRQHHRRAVRLTPSANYRLIEHYVNSQRSRYRRAFCACQERFVGVLSRFAWGSAGFVSGSFGGGLPDSEDLRAPLLFVRDASLLSYHSRHFDFCETGGQSQSFLRNSSSDIILASVSSRAFAVCGLWTCSITRSRS
jgi:hypothetical protein